MQLHLEPPLPATVITKFANFANYARMQIAPHKNLRGLPDASLYAFNPTLKFSTIANFIFTNTLANLIL